MDDRFKGRSMKQSFDWKLVICYLLLVLIGWVNIYASIHSAEPAGIFDLSVRSGMQFIWILTSLGLAGLIMFVLPPRLWESAAIPLYIIVIFLLVAVIFLGVEVKGSRSWFDFGVVLFQPAEVSKISTSLLLAFIMSRANFKMTDPKSFLLICLVLGLPMLIILGEKETGSALVYAGFIFVLYREGLTGWLLVLAGIIILLFILTLTTSPYISIMVLIATVVICNLLDYGKGGKRFLIYGAILLALGLIPWAHGRISANFEPESQAFALAEKIKPVYILLGISLLSLPYYLIRAFKEKRHFLSLSVAAYLIGVITVFSTDFVFNHVLQDHQRKRIEVLLGLKEDPAGVGYNVNQSMIAIGSGGALGKGYLHGTQTAYGFVPEQSTDFIFCTVGEEWGFLGCMVVILLYVFMIWRIIHDAERSRENFTRIYGYCVASCLFMHLFINIGMTIGLMPVIGIPLPLMSYGGSSLWAFTILIFIFIVLDHEEKKYF